MEHRSELVDIGRQVHEETYRRKRKEIELDGIKIDFFEKNKATVHEIKKSKAVEISHIRQLQYYLWYLKEIGVIAEGMIDYPLLRRREPITLTKEVETELFETADEIRKIVGLPKPPEVEKLSVCRKCSYYEYCFV